MKVLLIHRYFWPDTPPYALILKKIATRLAKDNHDVEVLSSQPSYAKDVSIDKQPRKQLIDGYKISRLSLFPGYGSVKIIQKLYMLFFPFKVLFHILKNRNYDLIMVSTSPPVLSGLTGSIASSLIKAKFLYHYMDIHPEIGSLSNDFNNRYLIKLLKKIDTKSCISSNQIIVLSEDMKDSLLERDNSLSKKIIVIPNFDLNSSFTNDIDISGLIHDKKNCLRLIFAGNVGRFQALDEFLSNFISLNNKVEMELVILGNGKLQKKLKSKATGISNIFFIPQQPLKIANEIIKTADIGIVSLGENMYKYAYPTKLISYLSQNCPILSFMELESDFSSFIRKNKIGICIKPNDKKHFKDQINWLLDNRNEIQTMKANCSSVFTKNFDEEMILNKWSKIFSTFDYK